MERRGEERKEEEEEGGAKKVWIHDLCMDYMIFGMDFTWKARILWFCMEF